MADKLNDIEEGLAFTPKFDANGLIVAVVTDVASGDMLMVAHMNEEALRKTVASGEAWYYSRSREALWKKGETSGHVQRVIELRVRLRSGCCLAEGRTAGLRSLPHWPSLLFLSRGPDRHDRSDYARISRRRKALRSRGGLSQDITVTICDAPTKPAPARDAVDRTSCRRCQSRRSQVARRRLRQLPLPSRPEPEWA